MQIVRYDITFKKSTPLVLAFALVLVSNNVQACAACGCTLSKDWEFQGITSKEGWSVDFSYDTLNQNKQRYGSGSTSAAFLSAFSAANGATGEVEDYTQTQTVTASVSYTAEDWGVTAILPYINRTHGTFGGGGYPGTALYATSSDSSIGDVKFLGRYNGFSADKSSGLIIGVKLPTGNYKAYFSDGVTPLDAGLQIGTGSTDVIVGGYTSGSISNSYSWFAQGTLQHAVATKLGLGGVTYRPGDAYSLNTGLRYAEFGAQFVPMLQLNMIKRDADTGTGVPLDPLDGITPISGGTLAYLAPGATYRLGGGTSVYGFIQLPVYQKVNSLQIVPSYTLTLGVHHNFE